MIIHLITVGNKMPRWVQEGYLEYSKRLPPECSLKLVEIAPGHRGKNADIKRTVKDEGERMLKAIPKGCRVVVLDVVGKSWSTEQLSVQLGQWMNEGSDVALLVGGPEGLAEACLERADGRWSLSALTLPHPLVRVIVSEQIYRAWSLLQNHPYHRA
jgi:23S rRNA (pseudouridine1915-N3)-methyltransferase